MTLVHTLRFAWQAFTQSLTTPGNMLVYGVQFCLMFALALLSFTMTSVQSYLQDNLDQMLGADLVISSHQALDETRLQPLRTLATNYSDSILYTVTLTHGDHFQEVQLKAVDAAYPLQGQVKVSADLGAAVQSAMKPVGPDEIWLDARAIRALGISPGDSLTLAGRAMTVSQVLQHEPDRLMEGHSVAMRALVSDDIKHLGSDLSAHGFRYLFQIEGTQRDNAIALAKQNFPYAQVLSKTGGHPLARFWQRAENFLGLSSVVLFLMGALAMSLASARLVQKQSHYVAVCLSLGASRRKALSHQILSWLFAFVAVLFPALLTAYFAHIHVLGWLSQFDGLTAAFSWREGVSIAATLLALLACLQIPNWWLLANSRVGQLITGATQQRNRAFQIVWVTLCLGGLTVLYSDNWLLTSMTFGALLFATLVVLVLTWLLLWVAVIATRNRSGLVPFAVYLMRQRAMNKSLQIMGLGLGATLLLFTLMLMKDLGATLERQTRQHDGNLMIAQLLKSDEPTLQQWLGEQHGSMRVSRDYVKATLLDVNHQPLNQHVTHPSDSMNTLQRPIRLHWNDAIPNNNVLTRGQWWQARTERWQQVSVEAEIMTDLNLEIGDTLTFQVGTQRLEFNIVASHQYRSGASSVTFWFQAPSAVLQHTDAQQYLMGSAELPDAAWTKLAQLWQQLPSMRAVSLQELTERYDNTLAQLTAMVSGFSVLMVSLAILLLVAAVQRLNAQDKLKNGVLRSVGLSARQCANLALFEWLFTALMAAAGAIGGSWLAGLMIYQSQFNMLYAPDVGWVLGTLGTMVLAVGATGWLSSRNALDTDIRDLLSSAS